MRLENVLALTHAKLINKPFVNNFENIVFEAKAVKRGDLFLAFNEDEIESAIFNGAYGIIFDKPLQMSDSEIAWIQVKSLDDALKRLLRFRLIEKEVTTYECNEVILKLALQVITEPNFIVVHSDIRLISKMLWNIEQKSTLLFCSAFCTRDIFTDIKTLSCAPMESIHIVEQTLFETSFICDNIFYERQLLSPFFIPDLEKLLYLFKALKVNYRLKKFTQIDNFQAVFVNKNFEPKEFGASDKVLIFEQNRELITSEINFLQKNANWADIVYIFPQTLFEEFSTCNNVYVYKKTQDIFDILKTHKFHFALIAGADKSILSLAQSAPRQLTLDF
jgi:ferrochelatase